MRFLQLNPQATISQRESLAEAIGRTGNIKYDFENYNDEVYEVLKGISRQQCAYLNMLVVQNKIFKLKQFLTDKGMRIITK